MSESKPRSAEVVCLAAEVRVLMAGSRQITQSVFNQLDAVDWENCEPMGRVNTNDGEKWMVGRDKRSSALVRSCFSNRYPEGIPRLDREEKYELDRLSSRSDPNSTFRLTEKEQKRLAQLNECLEKMPEWQADFRTDLARYTNLPLIVLAGLR